MGRGLSPQQRLILRLLVEASDEMRVERLSWAVAEAFDVEGNRVWDQNRLYETDQFLALVANLFHTKRRLLTPSHRASFSRSLRRLEDRGLLVRFDRTDRDGLMRGEDGRPWGRAYEVLLTASGRQVGARPSPGRPAPPF